MKKIIITVTLVLLAQFGFSQAVDEAFKKDVLKVIERSGSANQMKSVKGRIMGQIPEEKQAAFSIDFDAAMPSFYEKLAKVYMETYTKEDIKAMLAFYESPVGKKMADKAGELMEKSQAAGQEWGEDLKEMMMKYMPE